MVHIMCTILMVYLLVVLSVIVAITKNKVQEKYYIFYHFTQVGLIVLKNEKRRKKEQNVH